MGTRVLGVSNEAMMGRQVGRTHLGTVGSLKLPEKRLSRWGS